MLESLFSKCTSLTHFHSLIGVIDQVGTILKNSFGGPLEQETLDIIISLLEKSAKTASAPNVVPTVTPPVPPAQ